jgi:nucleotide-binding universal stress UspA family protein
MTRTGTILTATDLSLASEAAVARAASLARKSEAARLDLLHVVSVSALQSLRYAVTGTGADPEGEVRAAAREAVEQLAASLASQGLSVQVHVEIGRPQDEILRMADALGCGLIVIGAHGRHFVHQLLFGSTAERLLYRAKQPLLVVKRPDPGSYREVLVAVDFSEWARQAAAAALRLLPDAEVVLFHAVESPFEGHMRFAAVNEQDLAQHRDMALGEARAEMVRFVQAVAPDAARVRSRVEYGYPAGLIEAEVERSQPDLLVMGKHGRSGIEQLLIGSVTSHLVRSAPCDVLIVPEASAP